MFNRSPFGARLALATMALAVAAAPDHRMGHDRMRPGMFPGITFEPNGGDAAAPAAPGGAEAKTLGEAVTLFVQARDRYDAEAKKFGEVSQETKNNMDALQDQLSKLELTVKGDRPTPAAPGTKGKDELTAEGKAFDVAMRKGLDRLKPEEAKLLSTDSDGDGGFTVPTNVDRNIRERLIEISPVRELCEVVTISQGDTYEVPMEDESTDVGYGWVAERESRSNTATPKIRMIKIVAHEMYAQPPITQKLLDDSAFAVEPWLQGKVTERFAQIEGAAFLNGDGDGKPLGLLNAAAGITEVVSGHATQLTGDGFLAIAYDLPELYAREATWLMKRATIGAARMLKDSTGAYIWQPGLQADQPGMLLGRPYREAVDMPEVAASAYPVLFGDFRRAYTAVDRQGVRVLRDPYTQKPLVIFYTTKRTGGAVTQKAAMRKLKISA